MFGLSRLTPVQILVLLGVAVLFMWISGGSLLLGLIRQPELFVGLIIGLVLGITVHEAAHAVTAVFLGDATPREMGRVSLNPLRHLDPFGSLFMLIAGFGWGKPVLFNPNRLKGDPRVGSALVAVAGPLSNVLLALVIAIVLLSGFGQTGISREGQGLLLSIMGINIGLAAFNLLPIPPLDGFGFVQNLLPHDLARALEPLVVYGPLVLLGLVFLAPGGLTAILSPMTSVIRTFVISAAGLVT